MRRLALASAVAAMLFLGAEPAVRAAEDVAPEESADAPDAPASDTS